VLAEFYRGAEKIIFVIAIFNEKFFVLHFLAGSKANGTMSGAQNETGVDEGAAAFVAENFWEIN
jgi:hypothetical protein